MLAHYMREKDNGGCCLGRERLLFNFRVLATPPEWLSLHSSNIREEWGKKIRSGSCSLVGIGRSSSNGFQSAHGRPSF